MAKKKGDARNGKLVAPILTTKHHGLKSPDSKPIYGTKEWTVSYKYIMIISLSSVCVLAVYPNALHEIVDVTAKALIGTGDATGKEPSSIEDQNPSPSGNVPNVVPEEVKNFKPFWQKTFSVKKIFADERRIPPVQLQPQKENNSSVKLYIFDEFLSDQECEGLIKAHDRHVQSMDSAPVLCFDSMDTLRSHLRNTKMNMKVSFKVFTPGTKCLNSSFSLQLQTQLKSNWSYSTAFYPKESKFSTIVAHRIKEAMGLDPEAGGKFQITSYPIGKAYKTHTDCSLGGTDQRDRAVSVIMYLKDVEDGGETKFPELGISVTPKKGRALVWNNMSPEGVCEPQSRHYASVVKSGSKYILMRWYYYKSFYSMGKRMPGPSLPSRQPNVPMVMCDAYNQGSCRWYDEWGYQILNHYAQNHHSYA